MTFKISIGIAGCSCPVPQILDVATATAYNKYFKLQLMG